MTDGGLNHLEEYGKSLVALGTALQNPDTPLRELSDLATTAGIQLGFRVTKQPDQRDPLDTRLRPDGVPHCISSPLSHEHDVPWGHATYRMALLSGRLWCRSLANVGVARIRILDEWFEKNGFIHWMIS